MNSRGDLDFVPECYVDTILIETLLELGNHPTRGVNHQYSCSKVCSVMSGKLKDEFAVGIIDDDKRKPPYLNDCKEISRSAHIKLWKHKTKPHYIIVVSPAMETFIMDCAKEAGVELTDCKLPSCLNDLREQTKTTQTKKDPRFKKLFKALNGSGEMRLLSELLGYLKERKYDCEEETLKSFFTVDL